MPPRLLLIGGGRMGSALAAGWAEQTLGPSFAVDPARPQLPGLQVVADLADLPRGFIPDCVVLAVKPQMAPDILPRLAPLTQGAVFLSIMAGHSLAGLGRFLGTAAAIVRAMPNTPAAIRRGISVACAGAHVGESQAVLCDALLRAVGDVAWTSHEPDLDAVTAISGGGPAYVFLLAELLEQAGLEQGLSPELARRLARRTLSGAGALLDADPADAADLRRAVTSPKGTTERALAVLMADWPDSVSRAIDAATERSRELGQ